MRRSARCVTWALSAAASAGLLAGCSLGGGDSTAEPGGPIDATAGLVDSLQTVRPSFDEMGERRIELVAARNGFASFQVVLHGGARGLEGASVAIAEPPSGPGGEIGPEQTTIYAERLVDLPAPSDVEGAAGPWPDPLVPAVDEFYGEQRDAFPIEVPPNQARAAWVDLHVPAGLAPGRYEGVVEVSADGVGSRLRVGVEVVDAELGSSPPFASAFGMRPSECDAHGLDCRADPEAGWRLRALYVRAALENRIGVADPALSTRGGEEGRLFRRWVLPVLDGRPLPGEGEELRSPRLRGARVPRIRVDGNIGWWEQEAEAGGFAERAFSYPCDEPDTDAAAWRSCIANADAARSVWPGLATLVTGTVRSAAAAGALDDFDVIATIVNDLEDRPGSAYAGSQRPGAQRFIDDGGELWAYNSCLSHGCERIGDDYFRGWPSYVIDQPATEQRAMGPLLYRYRLSGELYYALNRDLATAWSARQAFHGNGDGTLFYPGRVGLIGGSHEIPIESIRMKRIRDGREDYALLATLARRGRPGLADRLARLLVPRTYQTDVDPGTYARVRMRIAAALSG